MEEHDICKPHVIFNRDEMRLGSIRPLLRLAAFAAPRIVDFLQLTDVSSHADLPLITGLIDSELSEPYSIFTYRYFINTWKSLCWLVRNQ